MRNGRLWIIGLLVLLFLVAGCSNKEEKNSKQNQAGEPAIEKKEETERKEAPAEKELDLDGEWVFLSDDVLGRLTIEKTGEDNEIRYYIGGSRINPVNQSSYVNALEGTGKITGNTITLTDELSPECSGVLELKGDLATVTLDDACHTPQVYLNGDYKHSTAYTDVPLLEERDGRFLIYGVKLGDSPTTAKSLLGNPENEGPDEDGFYEWVQNYVGQDVFIGYTAEPVAYSIHVNEVDGQTLKEAITNSFHGEYYQSEDGSTYLYHPDNEELLIFRKEEGSSKLNFFVTYADGNFHYHLESGWIEKIEW